MPYFLTSIVGKRFSKWLSSSGEGWLDNRVFGFYNTAEKAIEAVNENRCNMHEGMYEYLVIEHIEEGIHPFAENEKWFKWNYKDKCWKNCHRPKQFRGLINFALG